MSFKDQVIYLDCALTGKNYKDALHMWNNQKLHHNPIEWLYEPEYYLSDGGYSRMGFSEMNRRLFLTSNSRKEVAESWKNCKELIADVENSILAAIDHIENECGS
ncbi:MAG: hypothetical protein ACYS32_00575 [Planctomycetota bacterium]|jgi:hypothetical protein